MPDYAACNNLHCTRRLSCCRYRMVWGDMQSIVRVRGPALDCELYWPEPAPFKILAEDQADAFHLGLESTEP